MKKINKILEEIPKELHIEGFDTELFHAIAKNLGPAIYNESANRISVESSAVLKEIKEGFVREELGVKNETEIDQAIQEVIGKLRNQTPYRVLFYYLLVVRFGKEQLFLKPELVPPLKNKTKITDRITLNPKVQGGKPTIRNMRFTVANMLELLAGGMTPQEILDDYPFLEMEDIQACLLYASMLANAKTIRRLSA